MTQKRSLAEILAEKKAKQQEEANRMADLAETPLPTQPMEAIVTESVAPILNPTSLKKLSFKELLAQKRQKMEGNAEGTGNQPITSLKSIPSVNPLFALAGMTSAQVAEMKAEVRAELEEEQKTESNKEEYKGAFSLSISLNKEQLLAKELAFAGKSFCLVGAAGTGKTTAQREIAKSLLETGLLRTHTFKVQGTKDYVVAPSIAFVAYTRIASGNLRRAIHMLPELEEVLTHNVTTIHNLLEYAPETYWSEEFQRECFRFVPRRTSSNPLDITHLVIEESSMVGLDLWEKLFSALRPGVQIIFIGDINQLPPVFGDAILNYSLVQLPVVELTQVYRQAEDSSILANAHKILKGQTDLVEDKSFKIIRCGTTNYTQAKLSIALGQMFAKWETSGDYDPLTDIILTPWNKRDLGTDNLNKWIAQMQGERRKAEVFHITAGIQSHYLAIGDKVLVNKQVGVITKISRNARYLGRAYLASSVNLTRFGNYSGHVEETAEDLNNMDYSNISLDEMMNDTEDRTKEASHFTTIELDDGGEIELTGVGDYAASNFSLAYALTVHKAQGCEWRKVFLILHRDHSISLSRELFYTAVTRAREQLTIIAKQDVIDKAIKTQRIKGNTIAEKIEYFNSGISLNNEVRCTK